MKKNILIIFLIASNVLFSQTTVTKKLGKSKTHRFRKKTLRFFSYRTI